MILPKHKFFDSLADTQPSYREVSRYSMNSVLNTQQQMNKHGSGERRAYLRSKDCRIHPAAEEEGQVVVCLVFPVFRAEKGGNE